MPLPNIRQSITVYARWLNPESGLIKPVRCVLHNAVWMEQGATITRQTGNVVQESTFIQVFYNLEGRQYIAPHLWKKLTESELDRYWTANLRELSFAVPWASEYEFPYMDEREVAPGENNWIQDNPGAIRISAAEDNIRGTDRAKHILLRGG